MEQLPTDPARARPIQPAFSYAESEASSFGRSAYKSPGAFSHRSPDSSKTSQQADDSVFDLETNEGLPDDDEDELMSDNIIVAPRINPPAGRPKRTTRTPVTSYASPKRGVKKNLIRFKPVRLTSDLFKPASSKTPKVQTERNKVRTDIAEHTKPKRDAFFLHNKEFFLPLLPAHNYISKLEHHQVAKHRPAPYVNIASQPAGVQGTMKPYQLEGLSFLIFLNKNGTSGVLGDEMGLGKTIQTLSLIKHLKDQPRQGENRPHLIICPLSVLSSWMNECKKWVPSLNVVRFHGPKIERERLKDDCRISSKASKIDLIVTTYETFVSEASWFKRVFAWRYCVLDEGHKIKNPKSDVSRNLQGLSAEYRLLLTGTPLQNNLSEMWALLHWLYPDVFTENTADSFKRAFDLTKGKVSTIFMDDARRLLELVMLRRMKSSPGVNLGLPPKEEILLYVPLTPMQRFWYTRLLTKADSLMLDELFKGAKAKEIAARKLEADEDETNMLLQKAAAELAGAHTQAAGGAAEADVWNESKEIIQKALASEDDIQTRQWQKLMNLIMQLRKVCSHPYLLRNAEPEPYYLGDHIIKASGKFIVLDKLLNQLVIKQHKKVLIFSNFTKTLDLCEDLLTLRGANALVGASFRYMRLDGGTGRAKRNLGIRLFNEMHSDLKVMLISTRAGGLGINLTSASDVVFMDEDWNPQVTLQAEARAHRIGQSQKVTIYKLCTQGTVEEQMMGRIRKKLYLSAKVMESMTSVHTAPHGTKRKRANTEPEQDTPQLDTASLKSLVRRGAQTLSRPEIDVAEMLDWDWPTTLQKCQDNPIDAKVADETTEVDEQSWLNSIEKVETAVFEGKRHHKDIEKAAALAADLSRADRRIGKNTTVMIDGFAINKESLSCADWEAVPTMAGKDPRLAEPVREKKAAIHNQDFCQHCWNGGDLVLCSGCPRSYHVKCLDPTFQGKAQAFQFYCTQHECVDCQAKTTEAGGLIYRCRWCENGFCEDCLDWDTVKLIGPTLPEYEMAMYPAKDNAWFVECPACIERWRTNKSDHAFVAREKAKIEKDYELFLREADAMDTESLVDETPATISEALTPVETDFGAQQKKTWWS